MNIKKVILWIFIAGTTSVILYFGYSFYDCFFNFPECGYNDGPFNGRDVELTMDTVDFNFRVETEFGVYGIINRTDEQPPILVCVKSRQLKWAKELDVRLEPAYSSTYLWKVENLRYEQDNRTLYFRAYWTYGAEQGMIFLNDTGELEKMCLSW